MNYTKLHTELQNTVIPNTKLLHKTYMRNIKTYGNKVAFLLANNNNYIMKN